MKYMISATLGMCLAVAAVAQEPTREDDGEKAAANLMTKDPKAIEILKKVDAAAKAVKRVKYSFTTQGLEAFAKGRPSGEGTAILEAGTDGRLEKFRIEMKVRQSDSADTREFTAGTNGDLSFLIDPQTKMAHEDMDPAVFGSDGSLARRGFMLEFVHPTPFSDEINGEKIELKGTASVGGVDCFEIHVKYSGVPQEAHWFFAKKDHLPRRVDRHFPTPSGERGGTRLVVTNLVINPKFDKDPFKLIVPAGFKKTDEFAPMRRRLVPAGG